MNHLQHNGMPQQPNQFQNNPNGGNFPPQGYSENQDFGGQ